MQRLSEKVMGQRMQDERPDYFLSLPILRLVGPWCHIGRHHFFIEAPSLSWYFALSNGEGRWGGYWLLRGLHEVCGGQKWELGWLHEVLGVEFVGGACGKNLRRLCEVECSTATLRLTHLCHRNLVRQPTAVGDQLTSKCREGSRSLCARLM